MGNENFNNVAFLKEVKTAECFDLYVCKLGGMFGEVFVGEKPWGAEHDEALTFLEESFKNVDLVVGREKRKFRGEAAEAVADALAMARAAKRGVKEDLPWFHAERKTLYAELEKKGF